MGIEDFPTRRSARVRRRSFVLLEVLIAFGLVVSSGVLFLQTQMSRVKAYRVLIRDIALQNAYQEAVVRCIEALCLREVPIDCLQEGGKYDLTLEEREEKAYCRFDPIKTKSKNSIKGFRVDVRFFVQSKSGATLKDEDEDKDEDKEAYRFCVETK